MFNKYNVTEILNAIEKNSFQSKSDCRVIIYYFKCFLREKYKRKFTIDAYIKDVEQYINWYFSKNTHKFSILNKESFGQYEFYLHYIKMYKKNTITYKKVALRKFYKFLIEFNQQNINEESDYHTKTNRTQYNYLTKSYIRL
ncbi:hypothetical protein [Clostridium estertheticum]|uniref:hypothetical protein n=1 Tax=Clostridium estertheticum TaxID=238834 RepID=UPI001CF13183|nr:hypothetical protein [Clostridium estertheticum]MCB2352587.1 hypothetical protein [Clostridium estertheticum]WAG39900.1 hypothetical protein LL065_16705 [Clostridium estertheticum]